MSTPESQPPTLKSVQKVTSIPLINDGLTYAHNTLSQNTYTQRAYNTAQSISLTAFRVTQPIQARLAPIIQTADGLAAKGTSLPRALVAAANGLTLNRSRRSRIQVPLPIPRPNRRSPRIYQISDGSCVQGF
jgi:hypothetical protein